MFRDEDRISFEQAIRALNQIRAKLMDNRAWCDYDKMSMEVLQNGSEEFRGEVGKNKDNVVKMIKENGKSR